MATMLTSKRKTMKAAIEEVKHAVSSDSFANIVREANDDLVNKIRILLYPEPASHWVNTDCNRSEIESTEPIDSRLGYSSESLSTTGPSSATPQSVLPESPRPAVSLSDGFSQLSAVGDNISVYWLLDNRYYLGQVFTVKDSHYLILYNDEDEKRLDLSSGTW